MCVLQWLHGLERCGHRVIFLDFFRWKPERYGDAPIARFADLIERWWHPDRVALIDSSRDGASIYGLSIPEIEQIASNGAALLTIAAPYTGEPPSFLAGARPRILVDHDPGYTHLWAEEYGFDAIFGRHDFYYTVGGNIGTPRCVLPTGEVNWRPIWNPVVLDWWPADAPLKRNHFTTVCSWRRRGYLTFQGRMLGSKADEFKKIIDLPQRAGMAVEIALDIEPNDPDIELLKGNGWVVDTAVVAETPEGYREFISTSLGELSVAKGGYAHTRGGWFSDRSACYLASGRPVILQETGYSDVLPTGTGLRPFRDADEAAEAVRAVLADYDAHRRAAREIAAEHFDYRKVIPRLVAEVGL